MKKLSNILQAFLISGFIVSVYYLLGILMLAFTNNPILGVYAPIYGIVALFHYAGIPPVIAINLLVIASWLLIFAITLGAISVFRDDRKLKVASKLIQTHNI